jgi:capsid assembly protease
MTIALPRVAERLFGRPHAIEPMALQAIVEGPAGRRILSGEAVEAKKGKKGRNFREERLAAIAGKVIASTDGLVQYALSPDGVAVIPVAGVLTQKFDWLAAACGWTTYDGIAATLAAALDNYEVRGILFDVDSPGGEAAGMIETARAIIAARSEKPVWAIANALAASAAYAIAGSASKLCVTELAQVGSIGCVVIHCDQSAADKAYGLRYTAVYSGARKIDGWGHAPLSDDARAVVQSEVDFVRDKFAALVGAQGRLGAKAALATEAAVFSGENAVKATLADAVMSFDETLAALTEVARPKTKGANMTANTDIPAAAAPVTPAVAAPVAAAVAPAAAAPVHAASVPGPGEKCSLCGQTMPGGDEEEVKKAAAAAAAAAAPKAYSADDAAETAQLCQIAQATQLTAGFIAAKTPIAKVRETLAQRAADAADAAPIDPTPAPGGSAEAAVSAQWDDVVNKINAEQSRLKK